MNSDPQGRASSGSRAFVLERPPSGGAVLRVLEENLALSDRADFMRACSDLLAQPETSLVVDVTRLTSIYSLFIGTLVDLALRSRAADKRLTIHAGGKVLESLRLMNVDSTAEIEPA